MRQSMRQHDRDYGRYAAGLFAATVVMTGGFGVCLMIGFVAAPDAVWPAVLAVGGAILLSMTLWLFSNQPVRTAKDSNLYTVRKELVDDYVQSFRPKHRPRPGRDVGTNKPPSADDLRQIKEDSNAWYPSDRRAEQYRRGLNTGNE
jgi:hypothetical protein